MDELATKAHAAVSPLRTVRRAALWLGIGVLLYGAYLIRSASTTTVGSDTGGPQATATSSSSQLVDVHALARLEPLSGLVVIGARPGARIERVEVNQGDKVVAGQLLAVIEGHDQARAQLALAEAQKTRALHERSVQKQKLALQREKFDKLQKARNEQALRVLASKALFDDVASTFKELKPKLQGKEKLETELQYLEAETRNIKDAIEVRSFQIAGELVPKERKLEDDELGEQSPDIEVLDRQIDLARAAVAGAEIHAPAAGQVLEVNAHAGEVSSGPILALGDVSRMAAIAEVFQADVPRLSVGDAASVAILGQSAVGHVTRIGTMVARNQLTSLDPRALQDRRVVKVTIALNASRLAAKLVNMEVEVAIKPGEKAVHVDRASHP